MEFSQIQQHILLMTARNAIRRALAECPAQVVMDDPALNRPAGCFVSLHARADHRLRGCIGHMAADGPLILRVEQMGRAVLDDPRFVERRVTLEELGQLEVEITVLGSLVKGGHVLDFDPLRHGIYLTIGERRGCFLPQVARESGWSAEQLLGRLCTEKLGLDQEAWRIPEARLERFDVAIVGPAPVII